PVHSGTELAPQVAVGTVIADRPPHRSVRALLTHTAPALDHGVEAIMAIGMENVWLRQPPGKQPAQTLPTRRTVLATTADYMPPQPRDPLAEGAQSLNITRHCLVLIVASDDRLEPLPRGSQRLVHALPQLLLEGLELGPQRLGRRLPPGAQDLSVSG